MEIRKSVDSIAVSLFVDWLSLSNIESEANPNNNMMMRRAGLSKGSWYLKDIDGFTFSYCPEVIYPIHCIVYRESYKFITSYATVRVPEIYTCRKPRISDLMRCNNLYNKMQQNNNNKIRCNKNPS